MTVEQDTRPYVGGLRVVDIATPSSLIHGSDNYDEAHRWVDLVYRGAGCTLLLVEQLSLKPPSGDLPGFAVRDRLVVLNRNYDGGVQEFLFWALAGLASATYDGEFYAHPVAAIGAIITTAFQIANHYGLHWGIMSDQHKFAVKALCDYESMYPLQDVRNKLC